MGSEAFVGTDTMPVVHTWDCSSFFQEVTDTCVAIPISQEKKAEVISLCFFPYGMADGRGDGKCTESKQAKQEDIYPSLVKL